MQRNLHRIRTEQGRKAAKKRGGTGAATHLKSKYHEKKDGQVMITGGGARRKTKGWTRNIQSSKRSDLIEQRNDPRLKHFHMAAERKGGGGGYWGETCEGNHLEEKRLIFVSEFPVVQRERLNIGAKTNQGGNP